MDARISTLGQADPLVEPETPSWELSRYLSIFRRHIRLFGAIVLAALLVSVLVTLMLKPRYTGVAEVMIDARKHTVVDVEAVTSDLPTDTSVIDSEVEVLRSRALAETITAERHLDQDPEFNPALESNSLLSGLLPHKAMSPQKAHEVVVDNVMKKLKVTRTGLTYVIAVAFQSKDARKAADIANAFADQYIAQQLGQKADANSQANQWLSGRLESLRSQVESAEAAVAQYKAANGLMSAEGNTLTEQDISNLTEQEALAKAAQAEQEAKLTAARQQLARGSNGEDVSEALSSPVVQQLRAQRGEVSRKVADMESRYGPRYPDLIKAQRQLADIDAQIQAEVRRIISGLEAQTYAARQRTASVESSLGAVRGRLASNDTASVRLNELQRNADSARSLYQSFLDRFKQTTAQQGVEQADAHVLSRAKVPTQPSFPNILLDMALGLGFGLIAGAVTVILVDLLNASLLTSRQAEQEFGLPVLGTLPLLSSTAAGLRGAQPIRYVVDKPFSAFSEAFRNLRAGLQRGGQNAKVIAVTSALPGEGKTTATICLARTLALGGESVIVVDCDLRHRSLQRLYKTEPKAGLVEVLTGKAPLQSTILLDEPTGAHILPLSRAELTTQDVFSLPAMDSLLADLRNRYDYVLLDTPPVLVLADTRIISPKADAVLMLVRWSSTKRDAVVAALKRLELSNAKVIGLALTQVNMRELARSGADEADHYFQSFKGYYVN